FSRASLKVLQNFAEEFGVDPGFKQIGYLFLISQEENLRGFEQRIAVQRRFGVDVRIITPKDAQALVPALRIDDLIAAVWGPQDGLAGPAEVTQGFAARARALGARIAEAVEVTAIDVTGGRVRGVRTTGGDISAPLVINAAGPTAARVGRLAGVPGAVFPRRRHTL